MTDYRPNLPETNHSTSTQTNSGSLDNPGSAPDHDILICPNCQESIPLTVKGPVTGSIPCSACGYPIPPRNQQQSSFLSRLTGSNSNNPKRDGKKNPSNKPSWAWIFNFSIIGGVIFFASIILLCFLEVLGLDFGVAGAVAFISPIAVTGSMGLVFAITILSLGINFVPAWALVVFFFWYLFLIPVGLEVGSYFTDQYVEKFFCPVGDKLAEAIVRVTRDRGRAPENLSQLVPAYIPNVPYPGLGSENVFTYIPPGFENGERKAWQLLVRIKWRGLDACLTWDVSSNQTNLNEKFNTNFEIHRKIGNWRMVAQQPRLS